MATNFPSSLDSFTNPSGTDAMDSVSVPHADQHANLNDAMEAVQAKLGVGAGTIGEWQDYTPTFSGITVGNGTVTGRYCQINKFVAWQFVLVCGSTTSIGTTRVTYPIQAAETYASGNGGQVMFEDASGADFVGSLFRYSTVECNIYIMETATYNYPRVVGITSTVPFSWTTGDRIIVQDFYEAA